MPLFSFWMKNDMVDGRNDFGGIHMRVSMIQMQVTADKAVNLAHMTELVREAAKQGSDIVILPEMFPCLYETASFVKNAEPKGGAVWTALSTAAKENSVYLVGGSMPEQDGERIYNTCFVFDRSGAQIARHRKTHLFDVDVKGGQYFKESDTFSAGSDVTVFDTEFGKMGLCICFDMRFPELARLHALEGAKVIFVPAAFNMTTGPLHWELMFRSRAVDNQVFIVGCAPARDVDGVYVSYGNSMAADPWGKVLARADAEECIVTLDVDLSETERVRSQLPLLSAR